MGAEQEESTTASPAKQGEPTQKLLDDWRGNERKVAKTARLAAAATAAAEAAHVTAGSAATTADAAEASVESAERTLASAQESLDSARVTAEAAHKAATNAEVAVETAEADIVRRTEEHEQAVEGEDVSRERYHEREQAVRERTKEA